MRSENTMTVKELIEALEDFPKAAEVYIHLPLDKERTPGFDYVNTIETAGQGVIVLSNSGFWPEVYKNPELAGQIAIPEFDDRDYSGLVEDY